MQYLAQSPTQKATSSLDFINHSTPPAPYITLALITLLFIFLLTKQIKHRKNTPLKNKYTLLLILTPALTFTLTQWYQSYATAWSVTNLPMTGYDSQILKLEQFWLSNITSHAHILTTLFLLTTIITLLIQKPPLATTQTHP